MTSLARIREQPPGAIQDSGTVNRIEGAVFVVETETREWRARRATSCLLEPAPGDLVLITTLPRGQVYVLAVLAREEGAPGTLVSEGSLRIQVTHGELGLAASEGIHLVTRKGVSVLAAALRVRAADAQMVLDRLSHVGTYLRAQITRTKVVGQSLDTLVERVSQRVKRSYRIIEETDHVRADRIDYAAQSTLSLKAETAVISASHLAKVDGDQIHLG
jgi:hypothetical protein